MSPQHRFHQDRSFRAIYINSGKLGTGVFLSNGCALPMTQGNELGIHDAERYTADGGALGVGAGSKYVAAVDAFERGGPRRTSIQNGCTIDQSAGMPGTSKPIDRWCAHHDFLVYRLPAAEAIYQRFVGIEGSAYFV